MTSSSGAPNRDVSRDGHASFGVPPLGQPADLGQFLEFYPDAIAIHRLGAILFVNRHGLDLIGAESLEQVIGRNVLDFVHPDYRSMVVERMKVTSAGLLGELVEEVFLRLDGSTVEVEVLALPILIDGEPATQLVIRDISARKGAEREAAQERNRAEFAREALALAEEAAGLGIWDWDVATGELRWTDGLEPLHGLAPGTFGGTFEHFMALIHSDDRPAVESAIAGALAGSSDEFETEFRLQDPAFKDRWVLGKGRVLRDSSGAPVRMVGIGHDITDRKNAERALSASEQLLRLVTGLLPANVAYIDKDERYQFVNDTYRSWFDVTPDAVVGRTASEFMGKRGYALVSPRLQAALRGETAELEMDISDRKGGRRYIHAHYTPDIDDAGNVRGVVALVNDVTELHAATEALAARGRGLELLASIAAAVTSEPAIAPAARSVVELLRQDFADIATIDLFQGGAIERVAVAVSSAVPAEHARVLSATLADTSPPTTVVSNVMRSAIPEFWPALPADLGPFARNPAHLETIRAIEPRSGAWVPIAAGDRTVGVLGVIRLGASPPFDQHDLQLTVQIGQRIGYGFERSGLIERLQLALAAKDDFIGFVSHELRTPLTVLLGFAHVLARRSIELAPENVAEIAGSLVREAVRLQEIIDNMLLLARSERETSDEPVLVHRLVVEVAKNRSLRNPAHTINVHADGDPPPVLAPAGWIGQLIENLLSNAEKYSPPGTPIDIEVVSDGATVTTFFHDRGRGITEQQSREVFEPFFRAQPGEAGVPGIGLGLTVCRKLTERLGGEIWLTPREGGGTTAAFKLPTMKLDAG